MSYLRGKTKFASNIFILLVSAATEVVFLLPILVVVTNSFMTGFEIQSRYSIEILPANFLHRVEAFQQFHFVRMTLIPDWLTLSQYGSLFRNVSFFTSLWSSLLITIPSVVGHLVIAVSAAYAFELSKWRHKEKLFFVYLIVLFMPLPVVLVPRFIITGFIGISESMLAIILPAFFSPFGVFLLRQFMKTMPPDMIEAAKIDGAGFTRILVSIVVPVIKPAITALAILVFVDYWNVVDQALIFITDPGLQPLSIYLGRLTRDFEIIFAASLFFMLPAIIVLLHGQEYLVDGIKLSGLK